MPKKLVETASDFIETLDASARGQALACMETLKEADAVSFSSLVSCLGSKDVPAKVRLAACWIIGHLNYRKALPSLLAIIKEDEDSGVVWEAAKALVNIGSKKVVPGLVKLLATSSQPERRSTIAWALGSLQDKRASSALTEILSNKHDLPRVRGHAAEALGQLKAKRAIRPLLLALRDEAPEVRFWTVYALGQLKSHRAIPELERLAKHDKANLPGWWTIKKEAKAALAQIKSLKAR
jgi:HEAT repeat protein